MRAVKIPKRFNLSERHHIKIKYVAAADIQGQRGEFVPNFEEDEACVGIIRIREDEPLESQWIIYVHELVHAIHDYTYWVLVDHVAVTHAQKKLEENDGSETVL